MGAVPEANGPEGVSTDRDVTPPWESDRLEVSHDARALSSLAGVGRDISRSQLKRAALT